MILNAPAFAEIESLVEVCNSTENGNSTTALFSGFIISGQTSGSWTDIDASGATGILPLLNFSGVTAGDYRFSYEIDSDFPCSDFADTLIIRVRDCACPLIDVNVPPPFCTGSVDFDLSSLQGAGETGTWVIDPASGLLIDASGLLSFSGAMNGSFDIVYFTDQIVPVDCPDSVAFTIDISQQPERGNYLGDTSLCLGSVTQFDLSELIDGEDLGGE